MGIDGFFGMGEETFLAVTIRWPWQKESSERRINPQPRTGVRGSNLEEKRPPRRGSGSFPSADLGQKESPRKRRNPQAPFGGPVQAIR